MAVLKLSPSEQASIPCLERKSAEVRKAVSDTIRHAEEHVMRAEAIVMESAAIVDRARATLGASKRVKHQVRAERHNRKSTSRQRT